MLVMIIAVIITLVLAGILYFKNKKSKDRTMQDMRKWYDYIETKLEPVSQKVLKPFYKMLEAPREAFPPYSGKKKK